MECWFVWCSLYGSRLEQWLAHQVEELVCKLHAAFQSTPKKHKVVLNFDDLLKFSEEVRQCEEDQLQGMRRNAMF